MGDIDERLGVAGLFAGRALMAFLFLHEGYAKIANYAGAVRYAEAFGVPGWTLPGAIAVELGCGLMLVAGLGTRIAAVVLCLFSLTTALIFHTKLAETNQLLHFEKNLAIAGGLMLLALYSSRRSKCSS